MLAYIPSIGRGRNIIQKIQETNPSIIYNIEETEIPDFADIHGQSAVRRAAEIAAGGRHHFLMMGPPGAGKSLLAKCMPGILPPLTMEESLEVDRKSVV